MLEQFLFALTLTKSTSMRTVPIGIQLLMGQHAFEWNQMMAMSVLGSLPLWLGVGFTNLLHLYSPDVLVVGGGIANGLDLMLPTIEATIRQRAMRAYRDVPVVPAQLGRHAGLVGAASLVLFDDVGTIAARMPVGPSTFPDTLLSKTGTV